MLFKFLIKTPKDIEGVSSGELREKGMTKLEAERTVETGSIMFLIAMTT